MKKNFKKALAVLLSALMLLGLLPLMSFAEDEIPTLVPYEVATATISNGGDEAWFKFVPDATRIYSFESNLPHGDTYCRLYKNENDKKIFITDNDDIDEEEPNYNFRIIHQLEANTVYFFAVSFPPFNVTGTFPVILSFEHDCIDGDGNYICDICSAELPHTCIDEDRDYICDLCSAELPHACVDEDENDICDICSMQKLNLNSSKAINLNDGETQFFFFVAPGTGTYKFYSTGEADTAGVLYNSNYVILHYNDAIDFHAGLLNFYIEKELEAGKTYYFETYEYELNACSYDIYFECLHSAKTNVEAADASCTSPGHDAYELCTVCGEKIGYVETAEQLPHSFTTYTSNDDATCTQNCTETAYCDNGCGASDTRAIPDSKLPHSFVDGACTECEAEDPDYVVPVDPDIPSVEPDSPVDPEEPDDNTSHPLQKLINFIKLIIQFLKIIIGAPFMNS